MSVFSYIIADPYYDERLRFKNIEDAIDVQQILSMVHYPNSLPCLMKKQVTLDALKTLILPLKSKFITHTPNERRRTTSGREFEAMVIGRQIASSSSTILNVKKFITLGTYKFLGNYPVKSILFESLILIEIDDGKDIPLTSLAPLPLSTPSTIPYLAI